MAASFLFCLILFIHYYRSLWLRPIISELWRHILFGWDSSRMVPSHWLDALGRIFTQAGHKIAFAWCHAKKRMPIKSCEMLMPFKSRTINKEREWHYHKPGLPCHQWLPRNKTLWSLFPSECFCFISFSIAELSLSLALLYSSVHSISFISSHECKRWDLDRKRASPLVHVLVQ